MTADRSGWRVWPRALFALVAAVYLAVPFLPTHLLVGICVADDAFYYQTIARNIAAGLGSTFDGTNPTNGYHPLFMAVQVVLWKLASAPLGTVPLRSGLVLLALASLGTGWLAFDLVRRRLGRSAAMVTALLWLGNPFVLLTTHAGVEAPLATCALAGCAWWWSVRCAEAPAAGLRPWVIFGLLLGMAGLARTDSVLAGGVLFTCAGLWQLRQHGWRSAVRALTATAVPALLLVLPWALWSWWRFGHLLQDSGRAIAGYSSVMMSISGDAASVPGRWGRELAAVADGVARLAGGTGMLAVLGLAVAMLGVLRRRHRRAVAGAPLVTPFLLAAVAIVLFYALVFRFHQPWYLLTVWLSLTVVGGWAQAELVDLAGASVSAGGFPAPRVARSLVGAALPALALAVYLPTAVYELRTGTYPWQQVYLELSHRLRVRMPGRLGSFNSGIYGFFCGSPVVNLDGVVNGRAYEAMRSRRLLAYIRDEARLDYVLDHQATLRARARWAEPELMAALLPRASFPNPSTGGPIILWKVRRAPPAAP